MSNPDEVIERSREVLKRHSDSEFEENIGKSRRAVQRARELVDQHDRELKGQELLELLPQGEGSGLNADLLDGLHAQELIDRARTSGGAAAAESDTVKAHKQSHVKGGGDAFTGLTDELSFSVEKVEELPVAGGVGRLVFKSDDVHLYLCTEVI